MKIDFTVAAIPAFVAAMGAEFWWQRTHPVAPGTRAGDYQLADTVASLTMGVGSLLAPVVSRRVLAQLTPGVGRFGKNLVGLAVTTSLLTTVGDVVARRLREGKLPEPHTIPAQTRAVQEELGSLRRQRGRVDTALKLDQVTGGLAVAAVASTALTAATIWTAQFVGSRLFGTTKLDLGSGALALAVAVFGWDFLYYFNHRLAHQSRWLWAVHVVHHSSERYNLSTALRQPVSEGITMTVPYGLLALLGVRPSHIEYARQLNLIYQFWIHTEAITSIGPLEKVLNTPSHHRVHHGSNLQYLDRNHGSILIIWDKLFGTFEPERDRPVYGLTTNLNSFNPLRIASHELLDIGRDIFAARSWRERWSFLLRGPGWASAHRRVVGRQLDPVPLA